MSLRRAAGFGAALAAIAAIARSTSCDAGWDAIALTALASVLVGMVLFGSVLLLNGDACS